MTEKSNVVIPWVEKYRPSQFSDIVLDPTNREIFENILSTNYFPNLLLYGPPGTGKTTTIINLINEFQTKYYRRNKSNIIHLNTSDERGIDVIRNQIYQFVRSTNLFEPGLKFVVLDEVDYMTKNAQQALKYLLQTNSNSVRFCLICNYITKIDESLKNEFISVRFNQLPQTEIFGFIKRISIHENLFLTDETIDTIHRMYHSDIRSMINFIQLNQNLLTDEWNEKIMNYQVLEKMFNDRCENANEFIYMIQSLSVQYNIDKRTILNIYFNHLIRNHPETITISFLELVETILHINAPMDDILRYFFISHYKK
jgi:replication factor C subunit 3/5